MSCRFGLFALPIGMALVVTASRRDAVRAGSRCCVQSGSSVLKRAGGGGSVEGRLLPRGAWRLDDDGHSPCKEHLHPLPSGGGRAWRRGSVGRRRPPLGVLAQELRVSALLPARGVVSVSTLGPLVNLGLDWTLGCSRYSSISPLSTKHVVPACQAFLACSGC